jgi:Zn-dependent peptidase ImmA (M78 family)
MYEELVEELLFIFATNKPPVKPDVIACALGLKIVFSPLINVSGFIHSYKGSHHIILNSNDSLVRQRFTIAHELGHFFLHDKSTSFLSIEEGDKKKEREANKFAGTLLLPYILLKNYLHLPHYILCHLFIVSKKTLEIRLEDLRKERKI